MRPRYVLIVLVLAVAAAIVALGPLSGKSIQDGVTGLGENAESAIATISNLAPGSTKPKGPSPPPPPELTVSQPVARDVIEWDEYLGRFDAVEEVEVPARVSGYLTKVNFTDGQIVNAGDLLFTIDPRPFERGLEKAKAQLINPRSRFPMPASTWIAGGRCSSARSSRERRSMTARTSCARRRPR